MTSAARVAQAVVTIAEVTKELGVAPQAPLIEIVHAVAQLEKPERKRMKVQFDHEKFATSLDAIREHKGIQTQKDLADAIGIGPGALARLTTGKPVEWETILAVVCFSQLDLRKFVRANGVVE